MSGATIRSLGAALRDGAGEVRIHGQEIPVRATIEEVEYFSRSTLTATMSARGCTRRK